jgi:hypothetical protein
MLFKSTMRILLVETNGSRQLALPIVSNSYKKTLWLLRHREPTAVAVGVVEGPINEMSFLRIGEIDIPTVHSQVLRATNLIYTAIGRHLEVPGVFTLDYSLPLDVFIKKYHTIYTPDELLVILGIGHNKLFRTIGNMVASGSIEYTPENGPNKWSFYDYYWLNERYKLHNIKELDIRPFINRSSSQIKFRAHAVGFSKKQHIGKKLVAKNDVELKAHTDITSMKNEIVLTEVERDYMLSQISDIVASVIHVDR